MVEGSPESIRVLLVDDSVAVRSALREALEEAGGIQIVGEAGDGGTGLELLASTKPDVVVLDLAMPGMDGLKTLPRMKAAAPTTKICVLSLAGRSMQAEALQQGAHTYLAKSDPMEYVVQAVQELGLKGS